MIRTILFVGVFFVALVVNVIFIVYFALKESNDVKLSKSILYSFKQKESEGNLDELIEFAKAHPHKYKI